MIDVSKIMLVIITILKVTHSCIYIKEKNLVGGWAGGW
jgi:hypothetical protein